MASWPALMTAWPAVHTAADTVSSATVLGIAKQQGYDALIQAYGSQGALYKALLFGTRSGSIGETCTILLVLGGVYLIIRNYIKWQVPVVMIGTVGLLTWAFGGAQGFFTGDPIFHMLSGGLFLGAFFMATGHGDDPDDDARTDCLRRRLRHYHDAYPAHRRVSGGRMLRHPPDELRDAAHRPVHEAENLWDGEEELCLKGMKRWPGKKPAS